MLTDLQIAQYLVLQYDNPSQAGFNFIDPGLGDNGVCWAWKRIDEIDYIFLRGSASILDWFRDLIALAQPWQHSTLGPVHPGFALGMDRCWAEIRSMTKGPWVLAGHSLGAGRAAILSGLMIESGMQPLQRVVFGEPKPGFARLAEYIRTVPSRSYRNGHATAHEHDIVTDVPVTFPPEEYIHPSTFVDVCGEPDFKTSILYGPLRYHAIHLYVEALQALETAKP